MTSAMSCPCDIKTSACRSFATISSGLCFFFGISVLLHVKRHSSGRTTFQGEDQVFFTDYDRFYRRRQSGTVRVDFHGDRQGVAEPLKVAYLFMEKRTGRPVKDVPYVSSKEVETARHLLAQLSFHEIPDFLDYALAQAKKTNYSVQTLGGIRQYLIDYLEVRERRTAAAAGQTARQAEEKATQERMDYERFRRTQADRLFASLSGRAQAAIEAAARAKTPHNLRGRGSLAEIMLGVDRARITAQRHPGKIPSFDQWKAKRPKQ
jgi:hypothetical protein